MHDKRENGCCHEKRGKFRYHRIDKNKKEDQEKKENEGKGNNDKNEPEPV